MPNFITIIFTAEFLPNFNVAELEHEFELGDLGEDLLQPVEDHDLGFTQVDHQLTKIT